MIRPPGRDAHEEGRPAPVLVRGARREDVPALVRLRLANAERHVQLAPHLYRLPDETVVGEHFEQVLAAGSGTLVSVAEAAGEVAGMVGVVLLTDPPAHQILIPRRAAEVHTVVLDGHRGRGVGTALLAAAEHTAAERGVRVLYAGIFAPNTDAVRFSSSAGYTHRGTLLSKRLSTG